MGIRGKEHALLVAHHIPIDGYVGHKLQRLDLEDGYSHQCGVLLWVTSPGMRTNDGLHLYCVEVVGPREVPAKGAINRSAADKVM